MKTESKRVKRAKTRAATLEPDALVFVEKLAMDWLREGVRGDEPGAAREAFDLLIKHGYSTNSTRSLLYRANGSEVRR